MRRSRKYSWIRWCCTSFVLGALWSCFGPDPRSIGGALDAAARALEAREPRRLFAVIDERSRHAMDSIVADRRRARAAIEADYPPEERAAALAALGDAAGCASAQELFALRCRDACMDELAAQIGAPVQQQSQGQEVLVRTARGGRLRLHRGSDTWWGLVWKTEALARERDRAAEARRQIQGNAARYRRRAAARASGPTESGKVSGQPRSGAAK